jgi:hypothetical protein
MFKTFAASAAVAVTALVVLSGSAGAVERPADGLRNAGQIEVSSARRRYRTTHRYYGRRYYSRPYYAQPYYAPNYAYRPAPYYEPAPFPFIFGLPRW